jgi:hypothetical protein
MNEAAKNLRKSHAEFLAELECCEHQLVEDPFAFDDFVRASCQPLGSSQRRSVGTDDLVCKVREIAPVSRAPDDAMPTSGDAAVDWWIDLIGKALGDSCAEEREFVRALVGPLVDRVQALESRLASLETARAVEIRRAEPLDLPALPLRIARVA